MILFFFLLFLLIKYIFIIKSFLKEFCYSNFLNKIGYKKDNDNYFLLKILWLKINLQKRLKENWEYYFYKWIYIHQWVSLLNYEHTFFSFYKHNCFVIIISINSILFSWSYTWIYLPPPFINAPRFANGISPHSDLFPLRSSHLDSYLQAAPKL